MKLSYNYVKILDMSWTNFHNHCHYCDGKLPLEAHVQSAIELGVQSFGISCHCPVPFDTAWNMHANDMNDYRAEFELCLAKYHRQIQIYFSVEADYVPGKISLNDPLLQSAGLDYTLCSIHFVDAFKNGQPWEIDGSHEVFMKGLADIFDYDVKAAVKRYFQLTRDMVQWSTPEIVGHLDKIKIQNVSGSIWDENAAWYQNELLDTLEVIKRAGSIIEVNTRGIYRGKSTETYPGTWALKQIKAMDIPICLNSDAHHPSEITSGFLSTSRMLKEIGFSSMRILWNHSWKDMPFSEQGMILE